MSRSTMRSHTGAGLGIAAMVVTFLMLLPVLFVVTLYTFLTVYAIIKAFGSTQDASPLTVLLLLVSVVTLYTLLIGIAITLMGRSFDPRDGRGWFGWLIRLPRRSEADLKPMPAPVISPVPQPPPMPQD